jgi:hypothetical protein
MAWVKIDDHFDEHPKLAAVGPIGWGVWLAGLAYCNRNLTDGFIPHAIAEGIGGKWRVRIPQGDGREQVWKVSRSSGMHGEDLDSEWVAALLVRERLWEEVPGGYVVHDYTDYQPTREEAQSLSVKRSEAGAKGAQAKRQQVAKQTPGKLPSKHLANDMAKVCPVPVPDPDPDPVPDPDPDPEVREPLASLGAVPPAGDPGPAPVTLFVDPRSEAQALATGVYDALMAAGRRPADQRWMGKAIGRIKQLTPNARSELPEMISWALSSEAPGYVATWISKCDFGLAIDSYGRALTRASPPSAEPRGFAGIREFLADVGAGGELR